MIDVGRFREFMSEVEAKRGPLVLFALIKGEDSAGYWDLFVSGPSLERDIKILRELVNELTQFFGVKHIGLLSLSAIIILRKTDPGLRAILEEASRDPKRVEWQGTSLFDLPIDHAYILKAQAPARPSRKEAQAVDGHRRSRPRSRATAKRPAPSRK